MKTKITKIIVLMGAATLLAMPLQAGKGGGYAGECPNGFEPGTRAQQDRVRPLDGTGSQFGKKGNKGPKENCDGTGQGQGQGKGKGQGGGRGAGNGNPEDCPNNQP